MCFGVYLSLAMPRQPAVKAYQKTIQESYFEIVCLEIACSPTDTWAHESLKEATILLPSVSQDIGARPWTCADGEQNMTQHLTAHHKFVQVPTLHRQHVSEVFLTNVQRFHL